MYTSHVSLDEHHAYVLGLKLTKVKIGDRPRNNRSLMGKGQECTPEIERFYFRTHVSHAFGTVVVRASRRSCSTVIRVMMPDGHCGRQIVFLSSRTSGDEKFWAVIGLPTREIRWDHEALKSRDVHEYRRPVYNTLIDWNAWNYFTTYSHRFGNVRGKSARVL